MKIRDIVSTVSVFSMIAILSLFIVRSANAKLAGIMHEYDKVFVELVKNYNNILSYSNTKNHGDVPLSEILDKLNLEIYPETWIPHRIYNSVYLDDGNNNIISYFVRYNKILGKSLIYMDIHLDRNIQNLTKRGKIFPYKKCYNIFKEWIQPRAKYIYKARVYSTDWETDRITFLQGGNSCEEDEENKCLKSAASNDIYNLCRSSCQKGNVQCYVFIQFLKY